LAWFGDSEECLVSGNATYRANRTFCHSFTQTQRACRAATRRVMMVSSDMGRAA
jgi:hypothetical protein